MLSNEPEILNELLYNSPGTTHSIKHHQPEVRPTTALGHARAGGAPATGNVELVLDM
jgi:hypothetical protein